MAVELWESCVPHYLLLFSAFLCRPVFPPDTWPLLAALSDTAIYTRGPALHFTLSEHWRTYLVICAQCEWPIPSHEIGSSVTAHWNQLSSLPSSVTVKHNTLLLWSDMFFIKHHMCTLPFVITYKMVFHYTLTWGLFKSSHPDLHHGL